MTSNCHSIMNKHTFKACPYTPNSHMMSVLWIKIYVHIDLGVNDSCFQAHFKGYIGNTHGHYCKCPWCYSWFRHTIIRHFFICYPLTCLHISGCKNIRVAAELTKAVDKISAAIDLKTKTYLSFSPVVLLPSLIFTTDIAHSLFVENRQ